MYEQLIFLHSVMRWFVVLAFGWFLIKSLVCTIGGKAWQSSDSYFLWVVSQVFGYQLLFGFVLWIGASPLAKAVVAEPSAVWHNPVLFFFYCRHPLTMLLAFAVYITGKRLALKATPTKRYRTIFVTTAIAAALIFSAVPWPWAHVARPLLRLP